MCGFILIFLIEAIRRKYATAVDCVRVLGSWSSLKMVYYFRPTVCFACINCLFCVCFVCVLKKKVCAHFCCIALCLAPKKTKKRSVSIEYALIFNENTPMKDRHTYYYM